MSTAPVRAAIPGFWLVAEDAKLGKSLISCGPKAVTYSALAAHVNRVSSWMRAQDLLPGSTVAVLAENSIGLLKVILAALQIGVTVVPMSTRLRAAEISYMLSDSDASALLTSQSHESTAFEAAEPQLGRNRVYSIHPSSVITDLSAEAAGHPSVPLDDRIAGRIMYYTSGTSGRPKGVYVPGVGGTPEDSIVQRAGSSLRRFGIDPVENIGDGVHLVAAPLYHAAPLSNAMLALHLGHKVVVLPSWSAAGALEAITKESVTWTQMVPTMFSRLLRLPEEARRQADVSSLRWVIHAGAPCPTTLKQAMVDWLGPVLYEYYASTEGGGAASTPDDWPAHPTSVGRAWPGAEIRIIRDDRTVAEAGEVGTIFFRNDRQARYYGDPIKTEQATLAGYFTAGDLGHVDHDGYLYLADRRSDLIISGGVNIYPAEVEETLAGHPLVADVAVVGLPDEEWGQTVHAVVEPVVPVNESDDQLAARLISHCRDNLAHYKCPKSVSIVEAIPRNETGKLLRRRALDLVRPDLPTSGGNPQGLAEGAPT